MRVHRTVALTALLLVSVGTVAAQERVPNPEFADWSRFKKGTAVTLKSVAVVDGTRTETVDTTTLIEIAADRLILETVSVRKVNGVESRPPAEKQVVLKAIPVPSGMKREDFVAGRPPNTYEEGTETVKVPAGEFKAKWYKTKVEMGKTTAAAKLWYAGDVPGRFVKGESSASGMAEATTRTELTEVKKP
jgi:hypothetical protein